MKFLAISLIALFLGGCATDYAKYAEATSKAATAKALEKPALAEQLARLAGDDPTAKVAAIMAIAMMDKQSAPSEQVNIEAPYSIGKFMRDLTGLAVPLANVGAQFYGIKQNAAVAAIQSNNSTAVAIGDQRARVDTVAAVAGGMNQLGSAAISGLAAVGSKPTSQVTISGNGNAVNGSTADNSNNTNNCPQTQQSQSGNAGNGQGGSTATAGTSGTGTGGASAPANATQTTECKAGK